LQIASDATASNSKRMHRIPPHLMCIYSPLQLITVAGDTTAKKLPAVLSTNSDYVNSIHCTKN